jgi:hypothetical protein
MKNEKFSYTQRPLTNQARFQFSDRDFCLEKAWYHVRVRQQDGQLAWSSPVWIEPKSCLPAPDIATISLNSYLCFALALRSRSLDTPRGSHPLPSFQNVATGFSGDPDPPTTASGAAVSKNAQRFRLLAASDSASKSQLSKIGVPIATSNNWCRGCATPGTPEGATSVAASSPPWQHRGLSAISRRTHTAPPIGRPRPTDPSALGAHRPVRTNTISPLSTFTPAFFSQASRSSG